MNDNLNELNNESAEDAAIRKIFEKHAREMSEEILKIIGNNADESLEIDLNSKKERKRKKESNIKKEINNKEKNKVVSFYFFTSSEEKRKTNKKEKRRHLENSTENQPAIAGVEFPPDAQNNLAIIPLPTKGAEEEKDLISMEQHEKILINEQTFKISGIWMPKEDYETAQKYVQMWYNSLPPQYRSRVTEAQMANWLDAFCRLNVSDGYAWDIIKSVCSWVRKDVFWKENCLSPVKFRSRNKEGFRYFELFLDKMNSKFAKAKSNELL